MLAKPSPSSIRVAVRVRPLLVDFERDQIPSVHTDGDTIVVLRQPDATEAIYSFDNAFDSEDDASTVFANIGLTPQLDLFLGENPEEVKHIGICSYGQQNTGKTKTILMLLECTAKHLFASLKSLVVSYVQIKDKVHDLFGTSALQEVRVRDVPQLGFQPDGLVEMEVFSVDQLMQIVEHCKPQVHSCLFLKHPLHKGKQVAFVDLTSHPSSLLTFTLVMESLANKSTHARFRDSKLTMLLQPYLMDFTILVACISPSPHHVLDSQQTLSFATKTKLHSLQSNAELLNQIDLMRSNVDRPLSEELKTHRIYNDLRRLSEKYKTTKFNYDKMETRIAQLASSNAELFDRLERRNKEFILLQEELALKQDFVKRINLNLASSQRESQEIIDTVKQNATVKQNLLELKIKQLEREQLEVIERSTTSMLQFEHKLQELTAKQVAEREARLIDAAARDKDKQLVEMDLQAKLGQLELENAKQAEACLQLNQSTLIQQGELTRKQQTIAGLELDLVACKQANDTERQALVANHTLALSTLQSELAAAAQDHALKVEQWHSSLEQAKRIEQESVSKLTLIHAASVDQLEQDKVKLLDELEAAKAVFKLELVQAQQDAALLAQTKHDAALLLAQEQHASDLLAATDNATKVLTAVQAASTAQLEAAREEHDNAMQSSALAAKRREQELLLATTTQLELQLTTASELALQAKDEQVVAMSKALDQAKLDLETVNAQQQLEREQAATALEQALLREYESTKAAKLAFELELASQLASQANTWQTKLQKCESEFQSELEMERDTTRVLLAELAKDNETTVKQLELNSTTKFHLFETQANERVVAMELVNAQQAAEFDQKLLAVQSELERVSGELGSVNAALLQGQQSAAESVHKKQDELIALQALLDSAAARELELASQLEQTRIDCEEKLKEFALVLQQQLDESTSKLAKDNSARVTLLEEEHERKLAEMESVANHELGELEQTIKTMQRELNLANESRTELEANFNDQVTAQTKLQLGKETERQALLHDQQLTVARAENKVLQARIMEMDSKHGEEARRMLALLDLAKKDLLVDSADVNAASTWIAKFKLSEIKLFELQKRMEDDRKGSSREMDQLRATSRERSNSNNSINGGSYLPVPPPVTPQRAANKE